MLGRAGSPSQWSTFDAVVRSDGLSTFPLRGGPRASTKGFTPDSMAKIVPEHRHALSPEPESGKVTWLDTEWIGGAKSPVKAGQEEQMRNRRVSEDGRIKQDDSEFLRAAGRRGPFQRAVACARRVKYPMPCRASEVPNAASSRPTLFKWRAMTGRKTESAC
ncbi:hypothetical protein VTN49DRAFT_7131 [Thermomyces lanuginosus]|uniref:uncharacterized protein n=1 Tax=Thermomyces lanuginosus TaxID=5541 RepID=UPI0037432981